VLRGLHAEEQINSVWQRLAKNLTSRLPMSSSANARSLLAYALPMRFWRKTGLCEKSDLPEMEDAMPCICPCHAEPALAGMGQLDWSGRSRADHVHSPVTILVANHSLIAQAPAALMHREPLGQVKHNLPLIALITTPDDRSHPTGCLTIWMSK